MGKEQELLDAARSGNILAIEKLLCSKHKKASGPLSFTFGLASSLKRLVNVNCTDGNGDTPLHLAALNGQEETIHILLIHEASQTIQDSKGCTPLHLSAWNGNARICQLLLTNGKFSTALINLQNTDGDTALHSASQYGHSDAVATLLQFHADPNICNLVGQSALDLASQYGRVEVVKLLITNHPSLLQNPPLQKLTPLHLAARSGHTDIVNVLLDAKVDVNLRAEGSTALHQAAMFCKTDVIRLLVDRGIDVEAKNRLDLTAVDILGKFTSQAAVDAIAFINDKVKKNDSLLTPETKMSTSLSLDVSLHSSHSFCHDHSSIENSKDALHSSFISHSSRYDDYKVIDLSDTLATAHIHHTDSLPVQNLYSQIIKTDGDSPTKSKSEDDETPPPLPPRNSSMHRSMVGSLLPPSEVPTSSTPSYIPMVNSPNKPKEKPPRKRLPVSQRPFTQVSPSASPAETSITLSGRKSLSSNFVSPAQSPSTPDSMGYLDSYAFMSSPKRNTEVVWDDDEKSNLELENIKRSSSSGKSLGEDRYIVMNNQLNTNELGYPNDEVFQEPERTSNGSVSHDILTISEPKYQNSDVFVEPKRISNGSTKHDISFVNEPKYQNTGVYVEPKWLSHEHIEHNMNNNASENVNHCYSNISDDFLGYSCDTVDQPNDCGDNHFTMFPSDELVNDDGDSTFEKRDADCPEEKLLHVFHNDTGQSDAAPYTKMENSHSGSRPPSLGIVPPSLLRAVIDPASQPILCTQLPTPDHPPPSPHTAARGIIERMRPPSDHEKRVSRDIDTMTEVPATDIDEKHDTDTLNHEGKLLKLSDDGSESGICLKNVVLTSENDTRENGTVTSESSSKKTLEEQASTDTLHYESVDEDEMKSEGLQRQGSTDTLKDNDDDALQESQITKNFEDTESQKTTNIENIHTDIAKPKSKNSAETEKESHEIANTEDCVTIKNEIGSIVQSETEKLANNETESASSRVVDHLIVDEQYKDHDSVSVTTELDDAMEFNLGKSNYQCVATTDKEYKEGSESHVAVKREYHSCLPDPTDQLSNINANKPKKIPPKPAKKPRKLLNNPNTLAEGTQGTVAIALPEQDANKTRDESPKIGATDQCVTTTNIHVIQSDSVPKSSVDCKSDVVLRTVQSSTLTANPFSGLFRGSRNPDSTPVIKRDHSVLIDCPDLYGVTASSKGLIHINEMSSAADDMTVRRPQRDDEDEWSQIAEIMESFGGCIARESVFVRDYEESFTKNIVTHPEVVKTVGDWLGSLGLSHYENTFVANGFDDIDFLGSGVLEEPDLVYIGIKSEDERKSIIASSRLLPTVTPLDIGNLPASVEDWLESLRLSEYLSTFESNQLNDMRRVLHLWELELTSVLDITMLGHRKRILASLGDIRKQSSNHSPLPSRTESPRLSSNASKIQVETPVTYNVPDEPKPSPIDSVNFFKDYSKVRPIQRSNSTPHNTNTPPNSPVTPSKLLPQKSNTLNRQASGKHIQDSTLHIRPPKTSMKSSVKTWRHNPQKLIKGCCNYSAQYLGSTLVKELNGVESTIDGIHKMKKSTDSLAKVPIIMLSISYKGVKFIDAKSKNVVCEHDITNIFCACQDQMDLNFFAYITKDLETGKNYCHTFSVRSTDLAQEIILTLGEAFEIAYQLARKEQAERSALEFDDHISAR